VGLNKLNHLYSTEPLTVDSLLANNDITIIDELSIFGNTLLDGSLGSSNQVLKVNSAGNGIEWATLDALPSQSGNNGKYLTTDGSAASWGVLDLSFNATTDAILAGITINEIAYPATTRLEVTQASMAYLINNQYSGNNPTIYATAGTTIAFNLDVEGHPFLIKTALGSANYDTGLIHVATDGTVTTGSAAQGKISGTLYWQIPSSISGEYAYQCQIHSGMLGAIIISSPSSSNIGVATGTSLNTTGNVISHIDISTPTFTSNAYYLVAGDDGKLLMLDNSTTAATLYVPTDASANFTIGTQISLVQKGAIAGQITVTATTPGTTTINATPGKKLRAQWSSATLVKTAANTWLLMGDLVA
jgi:plastocyanin